MEKGNRLDEFVSGLHSSSTLLSRGKATVLGNTVDAVLIRNLYGQEIVWGLFGCSRGKFKGTLSNSAATEEVDYYATDEDVQHIAGYN